MSVMETTHTVTDTTIPNFIPLIFLNHDTGKKPIPPEQDALVL